MQRPRSHQAGELAENLVESVFINDGWIVNRLRPDYGYDFLIQKIGSEENNGTIFGLLQVKGTDKPLLALGSRSFPFSFDVADLLYWKNTPIPVYVAIVELIAKRIFILEARNIARELEARIGDSWASCTTRSFDVPAEALYTATRGGEISRDIVEYWDGIRLLWQEAELPPRRMLAPGIPNREDFLDVAHRQAKKEAMHFQFTLSEVLGNRVEMLQLLERACLREISAE